MTKGHSEMEALMGFMDRSTSPFHAAHELSMLLDDAGFTQLDETNRWDSRNGSYYVIRDGSIIAWALPDSVSVEDGFTIVAGHTDSPNLRLKPILSGEISGLKQFGIEVYGGALLNTWLDRDLGVSGRIVTSSNGKLKERLLMISEPVCRIPQLAIHLDRNVNEKGLVLNPQQHLRPIWGDEHSIQESFSDVLRERVLENDEYLESWDLMLHDIQPCALAGIDNQWLSSARIDNLVSCFSAISSLIESTSRSSHARVPMVALFNHEEVGSNSTAGAASNFLPSVLDRILENPIGADKHKTLAKSSLLSSDGAHATHPNYPEKHDLDHQVFMNAGLAIKRNSNERYATTAKGQGFAQLLCKSADIPFQIFSNRSDIPCGSTIGPIASTRLGIETIDMGIPQFAMHSSRELCGITDIKYLQKFMLSYLGSGSLLDT